MPILTVRHLTSYRYRQPVAFGEHRMMFRPREGHDQRLLDATLDISPRPVDVRWLHDVFGNNVAVATFAGRATELRFESVVRLDHAPLHALDFRIEEHALTYPFTYSVEDLPDLSRSIERLHADPEREVDKWARGFLRRDGSTDTLEMLSGMTHAIRRDFAYVARADKGIQDPVRTLRIGSGTCRDFAVLMIEAVRSLGLAARFVSGYLYSPGLDSGARAGGRPTGADRVEGGHIGGGSTHAWLRVYLPGAGWVEFDPTNGIVGNRDLIRVAVARDPRQAVPLAGTYVGFPADCLGMRVEVEVTSDNPGGDGYGPGSPARGAPAGGAAGNARLAAAV